MKILPACLLIMLISVSVLAQQNESTTQEISTTGIGTSSRGFGYLFNGLSIGFDVAQSSSTFRVTGALHKNAKKVYIENSFSSPSTTGLSIQYAQVKRGQMGFSLGSSFFGQNAQDDVDTYDFFLVRPEAAILRTWNNGFWLGGGIHISYLSDNLKGTVQKFGTGFHGLVGYNWNRTLSVDFGIYKSNHQAKFAEDVYISQVDGRPIEPEKLDVTLKDSFFQITQTRLRVMYLF